MVRVGRVAGEASWSKSHHKGSEGNRGENLPYRKLCKCKGPEAGGCLISTGRQDPCSREGVLGRAEGAGKDVVRRHTTRALRATARTLAFKGMVSHQRAGTYE